MKKISLTLIIGTFFLHSAFAASNCFIATENGKTIIENGDCKLRRAPCSTFKIAISLMGYDDKFLHDETCPKLPFKQEYADGVETCRQSQTPTTWIKNSCVWYSQIVTQKLGEKKFSTYVEKFNYGNRDISGDVGQGNGLTKSWLGSSLEISPQEQVRFLEKLVEGKLPVGSKAHEMTKNILFVEDWPNGWKFFGKTGSCDAPSKKAQNGWFVGWIQKENRKIIFASYLEDKIKMDYSSGKKAKEQARKKLIKLLTEENNQKTKS